jgi:hypothetical protein
LKSSVEYSPFPVLILGCILMLMRISRGVIKPRFLGVLSSKVSTQVMRTQTHTVAALYAPIVHRILSSVECNSVTDPISGNILDEICRISTYCFKSHLIITSIPAEKVCYYTD